MQRLPRFIALILAIHSVLPLLHAQSEKAQLVRGHNFEGVICTPSIIREHNASYLPYGVDAMWTPSKDLILQAEAALPAAVSKLIKPKSLRANYPKYSSSKNGTNLNFGTTPPDLISGQESDIDFLYEIRSYLSKFKRQYIGYTIKGKKVLLMSFFPGPNSFSDPSYLGDWKYHWVAVLDGGWNFWRVIFNPATGQFSDWQCNGDA